MQRSFARISAISLVLLSIGSLGSALYGQTVVRDRIVKPVDESQLTTLGGNVHPLATRQNDLGAAPVSQPMSHVRLVLQRSGTQEAALERYLAAVQDKNSPSFHKWLTPVQFGKLYGPSDNDVQKLTSWLQSQGFSIDEVSTGRTHIDFSGSVAQVQQAFHTAIHSYRANGVEFLANTSDPKIPSAFAAVVSGVSHLNTVPLKPMYVHGFGAKYDPSTRRIVPLSTNGDLHRNLTEQDSNGNNYLVAVPADVATIYDTPNSTFNSNFSGSATYDGTGAIIGVAGQSAIQTSTVANYRSLFLGDSKVPTVFNPHNVGDVSGDDTESYLDNEVAGSMAPGASIYFYTEPSTSGGVFQAADDAISANQVDILTLSYGDCESDQGNADNAVINAEWQQAAAQGITVLVSTGDTGSAGCDVSTDPNGNNYTQASGGVAVNGLGSTPYNIAVGGTDYDILATKFGTYVSTPSNGGSASSFYRTAKSYIPEDAWNDSTLGNGIVSQNVPLTSSPTYASSANIAAGAGGKSSCVVQTGTGSGNGYVAPASCISGYAKPSWQTGAGVPNDGVRDLPDVSLLSGDGSYGALWAVCDNSSDGNGGVLNCAVTSGSSGFENDAVGGTSAATPAFASILALVRQKTGNRLGQAAQTLYSLANGSTGGTIFHDVTTGNNSVPCAQSTANSASCVSNTAGYFYENGYDTNAGYDLATGLGSVDVTALVNGWAAAISPATPVVTVTPSSSSITVTEPLVVAVTVAGPTTGSPVPTGSVVLTAGSYTSAATVLSSGTASITVPAGTLSEGTYSVQVSYTPDTASSGLYFAGSSSASITVGGTFAVTPAASTLAVAAGATTGNTTTVAVGSTNSFAGAVNLTCTLTTPASGANASYYPACSIAPASLTLSGSTASESGTATATFSSTARSTSNALSRPEEKHNHWYTAVGGSALACVLFFGIPARRRSWKSMLALLVFLVGMAGVGCGGGGGSNNTPVTIGTTAGQYVFTVTGTDAATSTTTASTTVTLTVN